jgi:hypothetical protein
VGERGCAATSLPCAVPGLVARRATALDIGLSPNELSLSASLVCVYYWRTCKKLSRRFLVCSFVLRVTVSMFIQVTGAALLWPRSCVCGSDKREHARTYDRVRLPAP